MTNTLTGRFNHFICIQEEWLLNPEIKAKYKRYLHLLYFTLFFFHIIPLQPSYPRS